MRITEMSGGIQRAQADSFRKDLHAAVDLFFHEARLSKKGNLRMYLKTALIMLWYAFSYVMLVFVAASWWQGLLASLSLGLAVAAIGFNIQHDGSHKAYSERAWLNKVMALSMDLIGASSYLWASKHNIAHHTYTNITGEDGDINMGHLARLSPHKKRLWFHRYQHFYAWFLYGFLALKWQLLDDYFNVARGKVVSLTIALAIPSFFHPFWLVALFYFITLWFAGFVIAIVFQLAHVVEEADFPQPEKAMADIKKNWAAHQVETTVDFARGNKVLTWFLGGLNYQVEHHLFPRVCHVHYPRIALLVEQACRTANVRYNAHTGFFIGLRSHFRWLRRMGMRHEAQ